MVGWSVGWLVGRFVSDQAGWVVCFDTICQDESVRLSWFVGWLDGWLLGWLAGGLVGWLFGLGRTRLGRVFQHNLSIRVKLSQVGWLSRWLDGWTVWVGPGWVVCLDAIRLSESS